MYSSRVGNRSTSGPLPKTMTIPNDAKRLDTRTDMVIRFKGHGSYRAAKGEIKASSRAAPASM